MSATDEGSSRSRSLRYFMTIILTEAQYDERLEADKLKGVAQENFLSNGCEQIRYCHDAYINNECDRIINLRHGLELRIWSFEP